MLRLILAYSPIVVTFYVISVYGISYMTAHGLTKSQAFTIVMISNLLSVGAIFVGGRVADVWGRRNVLMTGGAGCLVGECRLLPRRGHEELPADARDGLLRVGLRPVRQRRVRRTVRGGLPDPRPVHRLRAVADRGEPLLRGAGPFLASWLTTVSGGSNLPITVIWFVIIVIALAVMAKMKEGPSLEGEAQYFGRFVPREVAATMTEAESLAPVGAGVAR